MNTPKYAICFLAQAPIRESVSHSSEMLSELLFGDLVEIKEKFQHWYQIANLYDNYEGWVDSKQLMALSEEEFLTHTADKNMVVSSDIINVVERDSDHALFTIGMGSTLPLFKEGGKFKMGSQAYTYKGNYIDTAEIQNQISGTILVKRASGLIHTPYLWGGRSVWANDCSGFVQLVFKTNGIRLRRDASQQATQGITVTGIDEAKAGDLMFFDNENEKIVHVGIYNGNGRIIHNSGMVRMDHVDSKGILKSETGEYSHHLCQIRRMFD